MDPVTAHFDRVADQYDEVVPFFASFADRFVEQVDLQPGMRVLDLGAGRGALTTHAVRRGCHVTAVDSAPGMVERLVRDFPLSDVRLMDAQDLRFDDRSFDAVLAGFVVHIVPDPGAMLAEVNRVLEPGGLVALTVPGPADGGPDPWDDALVDLAKEYRQFQADGVGRHGNGADEMDELAKAGFTGFSEQTVEVALPVPDGDAYWRRMRSHGAGAFVDGPPDDKRDELRARIVATVEDHGGWTVRRSATVAQARSAGSRYTRSFLAGTRPPR